MPDLNTFLTQLLYRRLPQVGGSGGSASGVLTVSTTTAGTIADTNETTLWTYSLPANTLDVNGRTLRITAWGSCAATANTKTMILYFGATTFSTGGIVLNGKAWQFVATVTRTGASTEIMQGTRVDANAYPFLTGPFTPSENTANAITIKVTGTNGTAAANDIVFNGAVVELLN